MSSPAPTTEAPPAPWQFSLSQMLWVVLYVAIALSTLRHGLGLMFTLGLPLILLVRAVAQHGFRALLFRSWRWGTFVLALHLLGMILLLNWGTPVDDFSWLMLCGAFVWMWWLVCRPLSHLQMEVAWSRAVWHPLDLLASFCIWVFVYHVYCGPFFGDNLLDVRGGRMAKGFLGVRVMKPTEKTHFIEHYLGPTPTKWENVNGGFVRHNQTNWLLLVPLEFGLQSILEPLPHEAAKRQVLRCFTAPENEMRCHQELLLAGVRCFGYPKGMDAETWWEKHQELFYIERNPQQAAETVWAWQTKMELMCQKIQIPNSPHLLNFSINATDSRGYKGLYNINEFNEAYAKLKLEYDNGTRPMENDRVVWWIED